MTGAVRRILVTTDAVGGVWIYSTTLARALAASGYHVTLVTMGPKPSPSRLAEIADLFPHVGLIITDTALEWMDPEGEDAKRAGELLLRIATQLRPDLIHLNGFREASLPWPAPVVVVAHSCVTSWWQACRGGQPDDARWLQYRQAVSAGLRAADVWVAPTESFRRTINCLYQPTTGGHVIHNGIDAVARGAVGKRDIVLASGRIWDEAKNIAAVAAVAPRLPWRVQIAGPLQEPDTAPNTPPAAVDWLGELSRPDLLERMQRAAIYVAPARYEPFGLGVLEAASAGCALVLSDIPTLRELWEDAAEFVPPDDADRLAQILGTLCRDDARRRCLQRAATRRAATYSIGRTLARYRDLYQHVLAPSLASTQEVFA
jgi:glycosyltransferase involved in cell wall biosynthesis